MDSVCRSVSQARERVLRQDANLKTINLNSGSRNRKTQARSKRYTDKSVSTLLDALIANPDVIKYLYLSDNHLTDESGIKIARFVAASTTIHVVNIGNNKFGQVSYDAVFAALHLNTSLKFLNMKKNSVKIWSFLNQPLFNLMHISPHNHSRFRLDFVDYNPEYRHNRFVLAAKNAAPPSMLKMLLHIHAIPEILTTKKH